MSIILHGNLMTKKILYLLFFSLSLLFCRCVMADQHSKTYWMVVYKDASFMQVSINGVSIYKNTKFNADSESIPFTHHMGNGDNKITIKFVDVNKGGDFDLNNNESFYINLRVDAGGKNQDAQVDVAHIEKKDGDFEFLNKSLKQGGVFENSSKYIEIEKDGDVRRSEIVAEDGVVYDAYAVDFLINNDGDSFRERLYSNAADIDLSDESVRNKILNKYKQIYSYVNNEDFSSFFRELYGVWDNIAYVYEMGDAYDYVKEADVESDIKREIREGKVLVPFDESKYKFESSYDGRLVRLLPDPIFWTNGEDITLFSITLYMDKDGEFHVADVAGD
jgi:hypothetical protein